MSYTPNSVGRLANWRNIEDERWHKNQFGKAASAQNLTLAVDEVAKAEGPHREGRWLLSGVPIYRDTEGVGRIFNDTAKAEGAKIVGFLSSSVALQDQEGNWFDQVSLVGIYTSGYIYIDWLPVEVAEEDVPARFGVEKFY